MIAFVAFAYVDEDHSIIAGVTKGVIGVEDKTHVRERLAELGKEGKESFENFRIYQLFLVTAPALLSLPFCLIGTLAIAEWGVLSFSFAIAFYIFSELRLTKLVASRRAEIESEFPALIEMLTLAIGAGESPSSAMRRISIRASGHLADEFSKVIKEIEAGVSFQIALDRMSRSLRSPAIRRFVDSIIISMSRGTPLIETLTHAVSESRSIERTNLLTAAGKAEITMMIPVVFLILPISILFALYPSIASLSLFSS